MCRESTWKRRIAAVVLGLALAGCVSPAEPVAMIPSEVPDELAFVDPSRPSLNVTTRGGDPGPTIDWRARISSEGFSDAVRTAIAAEGSFLPVEDEPGEYQLDITIEQLDHPSWSLDTPVHMQARWTLTRTGSGEPLWTRTISTTHTAPFGDAIIRAKRLRLAAEGAARANIRDGVREVSDLGLP